MPTQADWMLVSEFLDAAFEPTLAESQVLYAKLDTNRQAQLTYYIVKNSYIVQQQRRVTSVHNRTSHYGCITTHLEFLAAVATLCEELSLPGICTSNPANMFDYPHDPWLAYVIQRKFPYFGRGEEGYTDDFCARVVPDLSNVIAGFVRKRKLLTLLDVLGG